MAVGWETDQDHGHVGEAFVGLADVGQSCVIQEDLLQDEGGNLIDEIQGEDVFLHLTKYIQDLYAKGSSSVRNQFLNRCLCQWDFITSGT